MLCWESTRFGAGTSCARPERDVSSPTRGSPMSRCRPPTPRLSASKVRETGGVGGKTVDRAAVEAYLKEVDLPAAIAGVRKEAEQIGGLRGKYLAGLADCLTTMWDLAMEILGNGPKVPYQRSVESSTGRPPEPSKPEAKRERVAELLSRAGYPASNGGLLGAVDAWRRERITPMGSVKALGAAVIAYFDNLSAANLLPHLPKELANIPRANIEFLPIKEAWFSGSMNYLGRARNTDGSPQYEASYEINASLQISFPEFQQLVSHEVVPGHVTTFAYLQNLYVRGKAGFEATVLTMNTRAATLFEGLANNAILMAHGVTEVESTSRRRHADRRAAGAAAGRCQKPVVVSHLGRKQAAGRSRESPPQ